MVGLATATTDRSEHSNQHDLQRSDSMGGLLHTHDPVCRAPGRRTPHAVEALGMLLLDALRTPHTAAALADVLAAVAAAGAAPAPGGRTPTAAGACTPTTLSSPPAQQLRPQQPQQQPVLGPATFVPPGCSGSPLAVQFGARISRHVAAFSRSMAAGLSEGATQHSSVDLAWPGVEVATGAHSHDSMAAAAAAAAAAASDWAGTTASGGGVGSTTCALPGALCHGGGAAAVLAGLAAAGHAGSTHPPGAWPLLGQHQPALGACCAPHAPGAHTCTIACGAAATGSGVRVVRRTTGSSDASSASTSEAGSSSSWGASSVALGSSIGGGCDASPRQCNADTAPSATLAAPPPCAPLPLWVPGPTWVPPAAAAAAAAAGAACCAAAASAAPVAASSRGTGVFIPRTAAVAAGAAGHVPPPAALAAGARTGTGAFLPPAVLQAAMRVSSAGKQQPTL
jgi:hypothetical protein